MLQRTCRALYRTERWVPLSQCALYAHRAATPITGPGDCSLPTDSSVGAVAFATLSVAHQVAWQRVSRVQLKERLMGLSGTNLPFQAHFRSLWCLLLATAGPPHLARAVQRLPLA